MVIFFQWKLLQDHFANCVKWIISSTNHRWLLRSIYGFIYMMNLDLNMGHMSMPLNEHLRNFLTLIMSFRLLECLVLPQGISPTIDMYQGQTSSLFTNMQTWWPQSIPGWYLVHKGWYFSGAPCNSGWNIDKTWESRNVSEHREVFIFALTWVCGLSTHSNGF